MVTHFMSAFRGGEERATVGEGFRRHLAPGNWTRSLRAVTRIMQRTNSSANEARWTNFPSAVILLKEVWVARPEVAVLRAEGRAFAEVIGIGVKRRPALNWHKR